MSDFGPGAAKSAFRNRHTRTVSRYRPWLQFPTSPPFVTERIAKKPSNRMPVYVFMTQNLRKLKFFVDKKIIGVYNTHNKIESLMDRGAVLISTRVRKAGNCRTLKGNAAEAAVIVPGNAAAGSSDNIRRTVTFNICEALSALTVKVKLYFIFTVILLDRLTKRSFFVNKITAVKTAER